MPGVVIDTDVVSFLFKRDSRGCAARGSRPASSARRAGVGQVECPIFLYFSFDKL